MIDWDKPIEYFNGVEGLPAKLVYVNAAPTPYGRLLVVRPGDCNEFSRWVDSNDHRVRNVKTKHEGWIGVSIAGAFPGCGRVAHCSHVYDSKEKAEHYYPTVIRIEWEE